MKKTTRYIFCLLISLLLAEIGHAKVNLPSLISDGMVLQRDREIVVWGTADAGERIDIRFLGEGYTTNADESGNWTLTLPPIKAGGPFVMQINEVEVSDILVGDVWLCSGQSNMEFPISRVLDLYRDEVENDANPMIRHIKIPLAYNFHAPQSQTNPTAWSELTPENALRFSAIAYFFAKEQYAQTGIPVGLINASVGGSPAEAWISEEQLAHFPAHLNERDICRSDEYVEQVKSLDRARRHHWHQVLYQSDKGLHSDMHWFADDYDDSHWSSVDLFDQSWGSDGLNPIHGAHWFRREFVVPAASAGAPALLRLGCLVDADSVFINGTLVGTTAYQYPPRIYPIPAGILRAGENNVTLRLISHAGFPGVVPDKPYKIVLNQCEIDLEGEWKYQLGTPMPPLQGETFFQYKPTGLYNAMIAPLANYNIKGVLWYQGESNTGRYNEYYSLMEALIVDWRQLWQQPELPFLMVQLANFMEDPPHPAESHWAALRNEQRQLSRSIPHTGLVVTIDLGEWNDIHPLNKKDVGQRLSLQAQRVADGDRSVVADGPIFQSMTAKGDKLILSFEEGTNHLQAVDVLRGFEIAGIDGEMQWAEATIQGNNVEVWHPQILEPVEVRYAWRNNPVEANLRNVSGLPASPFQAVVPHTGDAAHGTYQQATRKDNNSK